MSKKKNFIRIGSTAPTVSPVVQGDEIVGASAASSWSDTLHIYAGTGRAVIVSICADSVGTITAPTVNGVSMTLVSNQKDAGNNYQTAIYMMLNTDMPSTEGDYTVSVSISTGNFEAYAGAYYYVDQIIPSGAQLASDTATATPSITLSVNASDNDSLVFFTGFGRCNPGTSDNYVDNNNITFTYILDEQQIGGDAYNRMDAGRALNLTSGTKTFDFSNDAGGGTIIGISMAVSPGTGTLINSAAIHSKDTNSFYFDTWVYKPEGFNNAADNSLPVLIFFHGSGSVGQGIDDLLTRDAPTPPTEIDEGSLTNNFIVLSPYLPSSDWFVTGIQNMVDSVILASDDFKIDTSKIFITGLSLGAIYISQFMTTSSFYTSVAGIYPMSGGDGSIDATKAALAVSRGFAVRGWYGDTDPNSFVIPNQVDDATALNNESAGFYELNAVAGAGHSPAVWGVPYSDYTSAGIYYEMENS